KTQKCRLIARPSSTLTTSSRLEAEKNQNAPVSPVRETACPAPVPSPGTAQVTSAWNREPFRQRWSGAGEQPAASPRAGRRAASRTRRQAPRIAIDFMAFPLEGRRVRPAGELVAVVVIGPPRSRFPVGDG